MTSRRVLMTTDAVGGVWTYTRDLARAFAADGTAVVLVTMGPRASAEQRADAAAVDGVTLVETDAPLDWLAPDATTVRAAARTVAGIADAHRVDLVQLHAPALAAADFTMPVVAVAHSCLASWWDAVEGTPLPVDLAWRDALTREGLLAADAVIAPSHAFAAALAWVHRLPFVPAVVHNGRTPFALPERPIAPYAFTAGRLWDRGKNVVTLDRASAKGVPIHAAGPTTGPEGDGVALHHLTGLGSLDSAALGAALAERPIFVSAALYEPFGLAVLEAAQAGCALVLADIPTFRELWDGAATFVAPRNADGFAQAIAGLLTGPAARALQGQAAATRAQRYSVAAMHAGTAAIHDALCRSTKRAAA